MRAGGREGEARIWRRVHDQTARLACSCQLVLLPLTISPWRAPSSRPSFSPLLTTETAVAAIYRLAHHRQASPQHHANCAYSDAIAAKFEGPWFTTQLGISAAVGLTSFLLFSYSRTRWPLLFAPRTKLKGAFTRTIPGGILRRM